MNENLFRSVTSFSSPSLEKSITVNFKDWLDYNFLRIGAYGTISIPQSSYYSYDFSRLRPVQYGTGVSGNVWETPFSNLVYESGYGTQISGIYVNSSFSSLNSGYYVDYPKGRVVFNSSIPTTSVVQMNYSYKYVTVRECEEPYFHHLQMEALTYDQTDLNPSGFFNLLAENRIRMPVIFISDYRTRDTKPVELGNDNTYLFEDFLFYIYAELKEDRDKLTEILLKQKEKTIFMYNLETVGQSGVYPLGASGQLNSSGIPYSGLINNYFWKRCRLSRCEKNPIRYEQKLFRGIIQVTVEVEI